MIGACCISPSFFISKDTLWVGLSQAHPNLLQCSPSTGSKSSCPAARAPARVKHGISSSQPRRRVTAHQPQPEKYFHGAWARDGTHLNQSDPQTCRCFSDYPERRRWCLHSLMAPQVISRWSLGISWWEIPAGTTYCPARVMGLAPLGWHPAILPEVLGQRPDRVKSLVNLPLGYKHGALRCSMCHSPSPPQAQCKAAWW